MDGDDGRMGIVGPASIGIFPLAPGAGLHYSLSIAEPPTTQGTVSTRPASEQGSPPDEPENVARSLGCSISVFRRPTTTE